MEIKKLQKTYIQKSRLFLYPLLEIKRGGKFIPKQSYVCWGDVYKVEDQRLILLFEQEDSPEFYTFEENILLKNKYFVDYYELENNKAVYIFDLSSSKLKSTCFNNFIEGKYSKMSGASKSLIIKFFSDTKSHQTRMRSYLNPVTYMDDYAILLNVKKSLLESVGELCDIPDLNKEELKVSKKLIKLDDQ